MPFLYLIVFSHLHFMTIWFILFCICCEPNFTITFVLLLSSEGPPRESNPGQIYKSQVHKPLIKKDNQCAMEKDYWSNIKKTNSLRKDINAILYK